nr:hypothetical protein [Tanacetum cinerariifolium]
MSNPHQELASPDQTVSGKDSSNSLMADNLPKTVWYSTHHVTLMKSWLVQKQTALGQTATGKEISNPFMAGVNTPRCDEDRFELMKLTGFLLPKVEKVRIGVSAVDLQVSAVRVGKGFSGVETPLFEGMLVEQQVVEEGDVEVHGEEVNAGATAEGDVSVAHGEVPTVAEDPSILSPTPPTPPPQPSHDIPSTSQVQPTPPQSPQVQLQLPQPQPQPQQDAGIPMNLLQEVTDTCTALAKRVEHLEFDKVAQALEITKLKRRVKKLEGRNKVRVLKLRRLQ